MWCVAEKGRTTRSSKDGNTWLPQWNSCRSSIQFVAFICVSLYYRAKWLSSPFWNLKLDFSIHSKQCIHCLTLVLFFFFLKDYLSSHCPLSTGVYSQLCYLILIFDFEGTENNWGWGDSEGESKRHLQPYFITLEVSLLQVRRKAWTQGLVHGKCSLHRGCYPLAPILTWAFAHYHVCAWPGAPLPGLHPPLIRLKTERC